MKQLSGCGCMMAKNKIADPRTRFLREITIFSFYSFEVITWVSMKDGN